MLHDPELVYRSLVLFIAQAALEDNAHAAVDISYAVSDIICNLAAACAVE